MSTDDWLEEFKIYILSTKGKTKDDEWYYHLRNFCSNHPGRKSLLKSLREEHRGTLQDIGYAISALRHPYGQRSAADYAKQRYIDGIDMPDPNQPLQVLEVHRELLASMDPNDLPSCEEQIRRFFHAISPEYVKVLGGTRFQRLSDIEDELNEYVARAHNPNYETSGGKRPLSSSLKEVGTSPVMCRFPACLNLWSKSSSWESSLKPSITSFVLMWMISSVA